jgi:hypothetical protein
MLWINYTANPIQKLHIHLHGVLDHPTDAEAEHGR